MPSNNNNEDKKNTETKKSTIQTFFDQFIDVITFKSIRQIIHLSTRVEQLEERVARLESAGVTIVQSLLQQHANLNDNAKAAGKQAKVVVVRGNGKSEKTIDDKLGLIGPRKEPTYH